MRTRIKSRSAMFATVMVLVATTAALPPSGQQATARPTASATPSGSAHRFDIDVAALGARLDAIARVAPAAERGIDAGTSRQVALVDPVGRKVTVQLEPSPVMAAGLAGDHPEVLAFRGTVVGHPDRSVALDIGPLGLHASIRGGTEPGFYIDPVERPAGRSGPDPTHVSYRAGSFFETQQPMEENAEALAKRWTAAVRAPIVEDLVPEARRSEAGQPVATRVYRLAMVTDPTFAAYYGGTADKTLQAKVAIVERVNQIYLDDFDAELELIDGNDDLDLRTEATAFESGGPCGSAPCLLPEQTADCSAVLGRASFVTGQIVGADTFDIGHVMLGRPGGGIAGHAVSGTSGKSIGCTGSTTPTGDGFAIDYVAHEIGHQMSASHTHDGCGTEEALTSRVEPGSGSTIMAYAGICGDDNLQPNSDPFMSAYTVEEVGGFMAANLEERDDEWQTLSLSGFDADAESVTLGYPGSTPVTLTRGANYTAEGIRDAVESLTTYRPVVFALDKLLETDPREEKEPTDLGFGFSFVDTDQGGGQDLPRVSVVATSTGVEAQVGVIVDGGRPDNGGYRTTQSGNHHPQVTTPSQVTIPVLTPFTLTGTGVDIDGDTLGYGWEQIDNGGANGIQAQPLWSDLRLDGPLFRVFGTASSIDPLTSPAAGHPTLSSEPSRTFPDIQQILDENTNAETGSCGSFTDQAKVDCYSELLPTTAYARSAGTMHFRLTARDSNPAGGGLVS